MLHPPGGIFVVGEWERLIVSDLEEKKKNTCEKKAKWWGLTNTTA
jgi:hypothetical protein